MPLVLISACLLGTPVRHDGEHKRSGSAVLQRWLAEGRVVSVCPEVAGGLAVPRPAAEITAGGSGARVLAGASRVMTRQGADVTLAFVSGATQALQLVQRHDIRVAVLKDGSPSCGSSRIHDGTFTGTRRPGMGVTAALLARAGVHVFGETQFDEADALLMALAQGAVK